MDWEGWLAGLSADDRARAERLLESMRAAGAPAAEGWVRSEINEEIPQLARFLVLRHFWPRIINSWRDDLSWIDRLIAEAEQDPGGFFADAGAALKRLRAGGADPQDIGAVARYVAYAAAFDAVNTIDEGHDPDFIDSGPLWLLMEADSDLNLTGRNVGGLHEDLLSLDPSGREGGPG